MGPVVSELEDLQQRAVDMRPRGITTMPNMITIHGMVRHRPLPPMKPMRNSMLSALGR
jgi:hypothetical protein